MNTILAIENRAASQQKRRQSYHRIDFGSLERRPDTGCAMQDSPSARHQKDSASRLNYNACWTEAEATQLPYAIKCLVRNCMEDLTKDGVTPPAPEKIIAQSIQEKPIQELYNVQATIYRATFSADSASCPRNRHKQVPLRLSTPDWRPKLARGLRL